MRPSCAYPVRDLGATSRDPPAPNRHDHSGPPLCCRSDSPAKRVTVATTQCAGLTTFCKSRALRSAAPRRAPGSARPARGVRSGSAFRGAAPDARTPHGRPTRRLRSHPRTRHPDRRPGDRPSGRRVAAGPAGDRLDGMDLVPRRRGRHTRCASSADARVAQDHQSHRTDPLTQAAGRRLKSTRPTRGRLADDSLLGAHVGQGRHDIDRGTASRPIELGVGTVEVPDDAFGVRPAREPAEVGVPGHLERRDPAARPVGHILNFGSPTKQCRRRAWQKGRP